MQNIHELFDNGFVLIDLETTGFPSDPAVGIVEVAVIDHQGEVLLDTLVNPERHIPSGASRVNNIYDFDVADALTFPQIYPQLDDMLAGRHVVAYNHTFEIGIFKTVCNRYALSEFDCEWHCAMRGYSKYSRRRRFTKLTTACNDHGIRVKNAHRALGDCIMTLELMRIMAGQR